MEISKTGKFTDRQIEIARMAKGFGHPARVAIIQHLFKVNACICGNLVEEIGLAQSTISQHLKELKHLGLIRGTVDGPRVCYCIDKENWQKMKALLDEFLDCGLSDLDCC